MWNGPTSQKEKVYLNSLNSRKPSNKAYPHVTILDADQALLDYLRRTLSDRYKLSLFNNPADLRNSLQLGPIPDVLLLDWHVTEHAASRNSLDLLAEICAAHPALPVFMLACSAEFKDVFAAARIGAADIILKPFSKDEVIKVVEGYVQQAQQPICEDECKEIQLTENVTFLRTSQRMKAIESQCEVVARTDIPVLILGESGTGKEVAALLVHKLSNRSNKPFLKVNCAAIPADLLESELFGFEQGAFTGALKSKPGNFEICNHGTIFLDEIGEMPPLLQAKLLQVLQDGTFSRLGGRSPVAVDVRVIAATNIDIKCAIAQKTFRGDLYYRLNGFSINLPPLRERTEEIPLLAQHFVRKWAAKCGRPAVRIPPGLMAALSQFSWPGNIRELENIIKRFIVIGNERAIVEELCPAQPIRALSAEPEGHNSTANLKTLVRSLKKDAEATAIGQALNANGWNRKESAKDLKISYKALLYKIKQYNLVPSSRTLPSSEPLDFQALASLPHSSGAWRGNSFVGRGMDS